MELITRVKNQATRIYFPLIDESDGKTFFTGTVWGSLTNEAIQAVYDDGTADQALVITGTPTESGTITGYWYLDLTAPQMNHDIIVIKLNADEIDEQSILITTTIRTLLGTLALESGIEGHCNDALADYEVALEATLLVVGANAANAATSSGSADTKLDSTALQSTLNAVGGIVAAIQTQTDKMNFTGDDIKCTLDGEKVSVSAMNASVITAIVTGVFAKVIDGSRTFADVQQLVNAVFRGDWSYDSNTQLLTVSNEGAGETVWDFSTSNERTTV